MELRKQPIRDIHLIKSLELLKITLAIILGLLLFLSLPLLGDDKETQPTCYDFYQDFGTMDRKDLDAQFSFGNSCYELENLTKEQLLDLALCKNENYWHQFCRIDDLAVCSQYSYLFDGLGFLTTARDAPNMCRFERYIFRDTGPEIYPNFGSYFPYDLLEYGPVGTKSAY